MRVRVGGDLFGRALGHDLTAPGAALRSPVADPVGRLDHVEVVLDHADRIARAGMAMYTKRTMKILDLPSFLRGAGRLLDVGGALNAYKRSERADSVEETFVALRGDWKTLGDDLRAVIAQEQQDGHILSDASVESSLSPVFSHSMDSISPVESLMYTPAETPSSAAQ